MEEALLAYLLSQTSITDLVSTRLFWVQVPQGTALSYIRLQVISAAIERQYVDASNLGSKRIQIDCFADTYTKAKAIERAVIALLNNERFEQSSTRIEAFLDNSRDLTDENAAKTPIIYRQSLDFMVTYSPI